MATRDVGLLILRVGAGLLMAGHGWGKAVNLLHGKLDFADPLGIGPVPSLVGTVLAELVCALLVVVGFKTRWAAAPVVFTMLVAAFVVHGPDPFAEKEHALLFVLPFLALMFTGPGRLSIDGKLRKA